MPFEAKPVSSYKVFTLFIDIIFVVGNVIGINSFSGPLVRRPVAAVVTLSRLRAAPSIHLFLQVHVSL